MTATRSRQSRRWCAQLEGAKEWSTKYAIFNANIERLESSPMWRNLLKSKRCIMPVTSFYEWPEKGKPPLEIFANGGHPFALAGLWSTWFDGGVRRESFAVITTAANDFMSAYHRAMPVILESKDIQKLWLLEGGMDILRGFECHLTGKPLADKIENVYPDRSDGLLDSIFTPCAMLKAFKQWYRSVKTISLTITSEEYLNGR
ncbi:MAG: SOS response-associated peptidase family protein [Chloracidobacterium sp.]|nr:SOS response-associated peptidase family protein [Chloracidobacterium sp.]